MHVSISQLLHGMPTFAHQRYQVINLRPSASSSVVQGIKLKKNLASVTALLRRATGGSPRGGSPRGGSPRGGSPRGGSPREGSPRQVAKGARVFLIYIGVSSG